MRMCAIRKFLAGAVLFALVSPRRLLADIAPPKPVLVDPRDLPDPGDIETAMAGEIPFPLFLVVLAVVAAVLARILMLLLRSRRRRGGVQ